MDFIDLHSHSTRSDGVLSPVELVEKAHASGVRVLALTDHDTMMGVPEAMKAAEKLGMRLIPGIEISTTTHGRGCHLLAYFDRWEMTATFAQFMQQRLEARERRFDEMVGKFGKIGIAIDAARVRKQANGGAITRPHVAKALLEQGIVKDYQEAFDKYLGNGKPCYVPYEKLPTADTIKEVHQHGGFTSVAHPGLEKFTEQEISDLKAAGLDGLEVYHYDHDASARKKYRVIAEKLGLLLTGGSDFHGNNHRSFYTSNTEKGGVPLHIVEPFLEGVRRAAAKAAA
ncbi:MAG: PHP domain-containing protein [Bdellovibrionota bacterium]